MKKNKTKYAFSAQLMNQAILLLLEKKDIEFITVTEITKKAGVTRSTFYLHYDSIYDLLEETIEKLQEDFINSFEVEPYYEIKSKQDAYLITEDKLVPYLNFVKENKRVLKLIHSKPQLFHAKETFIKMYKKVFLPAISKFNVPESKKEYKLSYFTSGVVAIINKWIETDCETPIEELFDIIKECIGYENIT